MKKTFFLLPLIVTAAHADGVFKCELKSGKTVYQSTPCESPVKQETIEIPKVDPRKVAEEEAKLKAWKEDFTKREAERAKAEQELQAEKDRKATVEALNRSAEYERQQAYEAKRQADALERQNMPDSYLQYQIPSYYPGYPSIQLPLPTLPGNQQVFPQPVIKEVIIKEVPQPQQVEVIPGKEKYANPERKKFIFKSR
jgi:hypothetical protein